MKQTAVEWLLDNLISEPYTEQDFEHNSKCWDRAKQMESENINNLPIYIHEGIENTHVYIEHGIVHVKPNEIFKSE